MHTPPITDSLSIYTQAPPTTGSSPSTYSVVNEWHRTVHPGRFDHCDQQPCHAIHLGSRP